MPEKIRLKIKDNFDLKHLDKFGFEELEHRKGAYATKPVRYDGRDENVEVCLFVDEKRILSLYISNDFKFSDIRENNSEKYVEDTLYTDLLMEEISTIYDLIQAGLVEKVVA